MTEVNLSIPSNPSHHPHEHMTKACQPESSLALTNEHEEKEVVLQGA